MWELTMELEENEDCYFEYTFKTLADVMSFMGINERCNNDHCKYHIEKVSKED